MAKGIAEARIMSGVKIARQGMNERRWRKSWLARLLRLDYGVSPTSVHRAKGRVSHVPERVPIPRVALRSAIQRQDQKTR